MDGESFIMGSFALCSDSAACFVIGAVDETNIV